MVKPQSKVAMVTKETLINTTYTKSFMRINNKHVITNSYVLTFQHSPFWRHAI